MFLKVVSHAWNIGSDFYPIGETDTGDLANSRVWLLWGLGSDFDAYPTLERRREEYRSVLDSIEPACQGDRLALANECLTTALD